MRRIINENGMSLKLVQLCNESKRFLNEVIKLFNPFKTEDIDYIKFTGDTPVGSNNLKPDITIRYNNGEKAYIEVKTNANTCYQKSQTVNKENIDNEKEQEDYIELLKTENKGIVGKEVEEDDFIESHLGYLLDKKHYEEAEEETLPKVSWNEIYEIVNDFGYRDFARDIKENVDGVINDEEEIKITPYDIALLYNSRLFNEKLLYLQTIDYEKIKKDIKSSNLNDILEYNKGINLNDYFIKGEDEKAIPLNENDFNIEKYYDSVFYNVRLDKDYSMYWGWEPEILEREIIYKSEDTRIEDYLYSFAIDKEKLDINKIKEDKIKYLEDEYRWIYFPLKKIYVPNICNNNCSCRESNDIEQLRLEKLNISKTILCFYKMREIFSKSQELIVDKLNQNVKNDLEFISGGWDEDYPGCLYIDIKNKNNTFYGVLSYGLNQNLFEEYFKKDFEKEENKNLIIADYFLSVWFNSKELKEKLGIETKHINNYVYVEKENEEVKTLYCPICRMTLCKEDYLDAFTDKVVSIIKEVLGL